MELRVKYLLYLFLFIAPTSVCTIVLGNISTIAQVVLFLLVCLYALSFRKFIKSNASASFFFATYLIPIILSYIIAHVNLLFIDTVQYNHYIFNGLMSRMINVMMLYTIMMCCLNIYNKSKLSHESILKSYIGGVFFFLVIFAVLQILNNIVGLPIPDIGTRSNIHSMSSEDVLANSVLQLSRVTSLANEPSYLAPFLIDAIILSLFFNRHQLPIVVLLVICVFTLSLGCYFNIFLLICYYILINIKTYNIKYILLFLFLTLVIVFAFGEALSPFVNIILNRKEFSFDPAILLQSSRIYVIWVAIESVFSSNLLNILCGFGPGSFEYLSSISESLPNGDAFYITSNNLFVDILYEGGLFALIAIIGMFVSFLKIPKNMRLSKDVILYKMLVMHLIISSMYRADFVSIRFFALMLIIIVLRDRICKKHYFAT